MLEQLDGFAQGSSQDVASWEDTRARVGELRPEDGMRSIGIIAHKCLGMNGAHRERSVRYRAFGTFCESRPILARTIGERAAWLRDLAVYWPLPSGSALLLWLSTALRSEGGA